MTAPNAVILKLWLFMGPPRDGPNNGCGLSWSIGARNARPGSPCACFSCHRGVASCVMPEQGPNISQLLREMSQGRRDALDHLLPLVYDELRRIAHGQL